MFIFRITAGPETETMEDMAQAAPFTPCSATQDKSVGWVPPLPKPDTHCFDEDTGKDVWSHSPEQMQAYAIAAIEAQGVPDGWQPIETAPESMDECVVVGWLDDEGLPRTEFDYKEDGCWIKWHEHAEHTEVIGGHGVSHTPPYTRWLKLPPLASAPPAPQAKPQPLSDDRIEEVTAEIGMNSPLARWAIARKVEAAHGITKE